jgi:hypothetical protein
MAMNDMSDLEPGISYFPDALYLVVEIVSFQVLLFADVREHAITLALPDIKGLPVSWVDKPINVGLDRVCHL